MWSGSAVSERGRMMPGEVCRAAVLTSTSLQTMAPKFLQRGQRFAPVALVGSSSAITHALLERRPATALGDGGAVDAAPQCRP